MKRFMCTLPVLGLVLAACAGGPAVVPASAERAAAESSAVDVAGQTITPRDMEAHIAYLASDELRGRDTPSPGLEKAAAYIAGEFEAFGLEPAGEHGSFLQRYPYGIRGLDTTATRLVVRGPEGRKTLAYGADYFVDPGAPASLQAELVFTGAAVEDVPGPVGALNGDVAVFYLPGAGGRPWQRAASSARQAAAEADAGAVLFVLDPEFRPELLATAASAFEEPRRRFGAVDGAPAYFLAYEPSRTLFRSADLDLDALRERALSGAAVTAPLSGIIVEMDAPIRVVEEARPPNVVALLRGSDPVLRDRYVVFSAHMDHVGVGAPDATGDSIYNGADDDASGTSALLEMAEAFASLPGPPARSLVFLAVSGEEKGLLGSRWFTEHPTIPLEDIVANVNMDMIGRNAPDSIVVIGQEYSSLGPLVHEVAEQHAELGLTVSPDLWPEERFFFRSDHFNFARKEIPALFFFAGVHEDYHQPSDEVDKLDTDKAARVAQLAFYTAHAIASRPEPPRWTPQGLAEVRALTR